MRAPPATPAPRPDRAPPALSPPPGHPRFPLVDSVRALAALAILVAHGAYFTGALQTTWYGPLVANLGVGVTVFFVISSFLLYRPFVAADLTGAPRPRAADFARRRLLRVVPGYWVALTVIAIFPGLVGVFSHDWWRYYGLLQVYGTRTVVGGIAAAWSLCIEMSFYLLLPLHALLMRRLTVARGVESRVRIELRVLAGLALASIVLRAITLFSGGSVLELTLAGTFSWFALGMALAVLSVSWQRRPREPGAVRFIAARPLACWGIALAAFLALSAVLAPAHATLRYSPGQWLAYHLLAGVIALFFLLPAVFGQEAGGLPRRLLALRGLGWLALVSYGLFLYQGGVILELYELRADRWVPSAPVIVFLGVALPVTIACAAASYYLVERPFLRLKTRRPRSREPAPVAEPLSSPGG